MTRCWSHPPASPWIGLSLACTMVPSRPPAGHTGTRAEHITDMLSVLLRFHANKLHAALSALFCWISPGMALLKTSPKLKPPCSA